MLNGYEKYLSFIDKYKNKEMGIVEFREWFQPISSDLFMKLGYDKGIDNFLLTIDYWFESIIYKYSQADWFELGLHIVMFYENLILNETRPILFPESDPILQILEN